MQPSGADESGDRPWATPDEVPPPPHPGTPFPEPVADLPAPPQFPAAPYAVPAESLGRPQPPFGNWPAAAPRRPLWPPTRREWLSALAVVVALCVVGAGLALLWTHLAPRMSYRVDEPGRAVAVAPENEEYIAADAWFTLLVFGAGLVGGIAAWRLRRARGPLLTVALAVGGALGAIVTWRLGVLLAPDPTRADLNVLGRVVHPALELGARAALMVEPLTAVAVYFLCAGFAGRDDLGHDGASPAPLPPMD